MRRRPPVRGRTRDSSGGRAALAFACALVAILLAAAGTRAQAQPVPVSVFPVPGSQLATPQTQITFRGIPSSELLGASIQVTGSATGNHPGTLQSDSDGNGGSFIPATPFQAGETVTVTTSLNITGGTAGAFHFTVEMPAGLIPYGARLMAGRVRGDVWRFRSRPDLAPAAIDLIKRSPAAGSADIFVAPQFGPVQNGPEIIGPSGRLVWFNRVPKGSSATDFKAQRYQGRPVLTWWQGVTGGGTGGGVDEIYDSSYRPVAVVRAGNGLNADLHEFLITPAGTALITAYDPVYWDASSVHGSKKEIVFDSVVQEIDIATGLVLFQWDSLDHVPLSDSYQPLPLEGPKVGTRNGWDYFHVNSVQLDADGNLVISGRNTWAAYKINRQTGAIIWILGGKHSTFRMGPGSTFAFQHDARVEGAGDRVVSVFDDGGGLPNVHSESRGLELALDFTHKRATVLGEDKHSPPLLADFEGNVQPLPGSDVFVGWGQQPWFTEFDGRGREILDGRFVDYTSSYRAFRFHWSGQPAVPPAAVATTSRKTTTVYASWNGATNVAWWRVLGGTNPKQPHLIRTVAATGFETAINVTATRYVVAQALDWRRRVLGTSSVVKAG